ncbi:MAG TPA: xylulokinase [Chthoniobacterales bacterium]
MSYLLGIDLGTSSVKVVVVTTAGKVVGLGNAEYPIQTPAPGAAEQDPDTWWDATVSAVRTALAAARPEEIIGIGFSGQMHGTVLLDGGHKPLRPAIIWADQRSAEVLDAIEQKVGHAALTTTCGTAPAAGFQVATLVWLQRHEPAVLARTDVVILPKDYVRLRMTGEICTDESDASATGLFDVRGRRWPKAVVEQLGLDPAILPRVAKSSEVAGELQPEAAAAFGLPAGIPVVVGSADQPAQAVGNGLFEPGLGSVTLGTGGQVFVPLTVPTIDPQLRLHTFCHAHPERWYLLGAMLAAGMALRWFRHWTGNLSYADLDRLAGAVEPGSEGLRFLPYLVGERSPLMDAKAKGGFIGLTLRHDLGHMTRAVLEGIAFSLRHIVEVMDEAGARPERFIASGNGLGSPIWRQMLADVLNRPLYRSQDPHAAERAGVGAALLAGLGTKVYADFAEVQRLAPALTEETRPDPGRAERYNDAYRDFRELYPRLKPYFQQSTA